MQPNYYAIIPAEVRYDRDLTPNAKLLYGEITALANAKGYCYASNQYFADLYDVDKTRVSKWVSSLKQKGYINISIDEKTFERHISLPLAQKDKGGCEKGQAPLSIKTSSLVEKDKPPCPKGQHNNTVNTTREIPVALSDESDPSVEVIGVGKINCTNVAVYVADVADPVRLSFLTENAGRQFPNVTELTKSIRAFREQLKPKKGPMKRPTLDEIKNYMSEKNMPVIEAERFFNFHESKGWYVGNKPMEKWKAAVATWMNSPFRQLQRNTTDNTPPRIPDPNPATYGTPASADERAKRAEASMQIKREREAAELPF